MKLFILFSICLVAALAVPENSSPVFVKKIQNRIVDGEDAIRGQFPWQVGLQCLQPIHGSWFCGGSLISPQWVLTAAQCAVRIQRFIMWFGGLTVNSDEDGRLEVESWEFYIHEGYTSLYKHNDVALIKLPEPIELSDSISPIRLPRRGETIGDNQVVQISGWGKTSDDSTMSSTLKYVDVTTISNEQCAEVYGMDAIFNSTVCAIGNPQHSPCNSDTGGPLVHIDEDTGVATLHGIISFVHADGCASGNPSGYVRTESMLSWIAEKTGLDV